VFISACTIAGYVVCIVLIQSGVAFAFMRRLWLFRRTRPRDESLPKAAIVLSVRGSDPQLAETIERLLCQDYPAYVIHIVADSEQDPAVAVIRDVLQRRGATNVTISYLRGRRTNCSLKCHALAQAIDELADDCEVVAFIDGDALPYAAWLNDLVAPLRDPKVGVTTGNRWYAPATEQWGSLVRYFWNAGAIVQVWMNGIVWAGSMAMRTEVIREIGLVDAWGRALSVDATVGRLLHQHGYGVRFIPGVLLVNTETISLGRFMTWVQRQLVAAKSSGGGWIMVGLHTFALTAIQLVSFSLLVAGLMIGNYLVAGISGAALALCWGSSLATAMAIEWLVRRVVNSYGGQCRWLRWATLARLPLALVLTYAVFPCLFVGASFRRKVAWRGVQYEILANRAVRMIAYQPIGAASEMDANASVM